MSCFFCLRSNSRKYLNPQDLDSDSCGNAEEELVSSFHEFSLRNLYRYLNLLHSDKEEKDFKDLKMPICEDCFRLNGEFNKLYNLLEETKLRLDWCLKKLQDAMTKAKAASRNDKDKDVKMMGMEGEEDDDDKILEIWRAHTLDRMKAFSHASFPRVLLHTNKRKRQFPWIKEEKIAKMRMEDDKVMSTLGVETIDHQPCSLPPLFTDHDRHLFKDTLVDGDKNCDLQHPVIGFSNMQAFPENVELDIQMKCDVTETFMQSTSMENTEAYDVGDGYDDETNVKYVTAFASQDERKAEPRFRCRVRIRRRGRPAFISKFTPVSNNRAKVCCKSCKKILNRCKAFDHWTHDCINGLRQPVASKKSKYSKKCNYCSHVCGADVRGRWTSMLKHKVRFHPEHYLLDEVERNEASGFRPERFQQILWNIVFPKFIKTGEGYASCSLCGIDYRSTNMTQNVGNVRQHLIFQHRTELREDLKIVQEDQRLDNKTIKSTSTRRTNNGNPKKSTTNLSTNCTYCNFKTVSLAGARHVSYTMKRHLVGFHPEHYLLDAKDKAKGLWHDQFLKILTNLIYPDFIQKDGHRRSCTSCGKLFENKLSGQNTRCLKRHLIFHHKQELKGKFKAILEDPLLEERLETCDSSSGVSCTKTKTSKSLSSDCLYCSYKTASPPGSSSAFGSMVHHLIRFHPEHYLIDEKDKAEGLWQQFRTILTDMVYPNLIQKMEHHRRSCSLCGKMFENKFACRNDFLSKKHLIFQHTSEVKEHVKAILEDPLLGEKFKTCNSNQAQPNEVPRAKHISKAKAKRNCSSNCGKLKTRNLSSLALPRATNSTKAKTKYSLKCPYCSYKAVPPTGTASTMVTHLKCFHPEHFLLDEKDKAAGLWHEQFPTILTNMICPDFILNEHHRRSCTLCGKTFKHVNASRNTFMLKRHLIFNHKTELKEKFKVALEDPSFEDRLKGCNVA